MKVLFLKDVGGVGQRNTIKEVSDGYGQNYLIAQGLAVQATPERLKKFETEQKAADTEREKDTAALRAKIQALEGKTVEITARATEKGGLFKAVTAVDVQKALGANVPTDAIQMQKPIKEIGEHPLTVEASGARAKITLAIKAA